MYEDGRMTSRLRARVGRVRGLPISTGGRKPGGLRHLQRGFGQTTSIAWSWQHLLCSIVAPDVERTIVSGAARGGDVRHCTADGSAARTRI